MKVFRLFPSEFPALRESFLFFLGNVAHVEMGTFIVSPFIIKGNVVSCAGNFQPIVSTSGNNLFPDCFPQSFQQPLKGV